MRLSIAILTALFLGIAASACEPTQSEEPTKPEKSDQVAQKGPKADAGPEYQYSPFGVRLHTGEHFHLISFKDVGLERKNHSETAPILEAIAQSVAYELQKRRDLEVTPEVFYDPDLGDPSKHRACGDHHLYVDVWQSRDPDRYGYSLWSGCGEAGKFAWDEVPIQGSVDRSLAEQVTPMGQGIVDSLAEAHERECFSKNC
jgi:hypothetical protein